MIEYNCYSEKELNSVLEKEIRMAILTTPEDFRVKYYNQNGYKIGEFRIKMTEKNYNQKIQNIIKQIKIEDIISTRI